LGDKEICEGHDNIGRRARFVGQQYIGEDIGLGACFHSPLPAHSSTHNPTILDLTESNLQRRGDYHLQTIEFIPPRSTDIVK